MSTKPARKPKPLDMAKIIAIYNQKGGSGKTMATMQLAGTLAKRGYRVMVIDMDRQGTASRWSANSNPDRPFPASVVSLAAYSDKFVHELEKMVELYDFIIVDCPPAIESTAPWAALQSADLALITVFPILDNIWASEEAAELGMRAMQDNPSLVLRYLVSRMKRGNLYESCLKLLRTDGEIKAMKSVLMDRIAYPESQALGYTVHGRNKAAVEEVEAMANEVLSLLSIRR